MSKQRIDALKKQLAAEESKLSTELRKKRDEALTPKVKFLVDELTRNTAHKGKNGLLTITHTAATYEDEAKKESFGDWLQNTLTAAKITFEHDTRYKKIDGETIDNTRSPDCGWDTPSTSYLKGKEERTHLFTIDVTQDGFEKHLKNAVVISRLEAALEKLGDPKLMSDAVKKGLRQGIEKDLNAEIKSIAGQNRG